MSRTVVADAGRNGSWFHSSIKVGPWEDPLSWSEKNLTEPNTGILMENQL